MLGAHYNPVSADLADTAWSPPEEERIRAEFAMLDLNGDGVVSFREVAIATKAIFGDSVPDEEVFQAATEVRLRQ